MSTPRLSPQKPQQKQPTSRILRMLKRVNLRLSRSFGVEGARKREIYSSVALAATLRDSGYWMQTGCAAAIATLGLALNSPAVIIGAMLISPMMGPILSAGMAFATGDLVLGVRSGTKLVLSCVVAVVLSIVLVATLPFKELTAEIAARTRPNLLDLGVALFSGAVGSIALCREVKGIATSIPGVAIAVALMPPLCVVGYGMGLTFSGVPEGLGVAGGGGLLFLTNLVAITFTAMLVFLILGMDSAAVRRKIRQDEQTDPESQRIRRFFDQVHLSARMRQVGGFPGRFMMISLPLVLLMVPLGRSLGQLQQEYTRLREDSRINRIVSEVWQARFARLPNGAPRSNIDQTVISAQDDQQINITVRAFSSEPLNVAERAEFEGLVAARLDRPLGSVRLDLLEIPTTAGLLTVRARESRLSEPLAPTIGQLRSNFMQGVQGALASLRLPSDFTLLDHRVSLSAAGPMTAEILYLGARDIEEDARELLYGEVRSRLSDPGVNVTMRRIPDSVALQSFRLNSSTLSQANTQLLDELGQTLSAMPLLQIHITSNQTPGESPELWKERAEAMAGYLSEKQGVASERIAIAQGERGDRSVTIQIARQF